MSKSKKTNKSNYIELVGILCAIAIIFTIWISYPRFMQFMDEPLENENPKVIVPFKPNLEQKAVESESESKFQKVGEAYGTYGDSYGSLNTLFSGLAFAVLIISLFMQRQELRAQREELEAQRNEIKESNAIANEQRKIAEKQRLITEQQAQLNKQQILDAKVQNFYTLLFKFLDEKRRKIHELEDQVTGTSSRKFNPFDLFISRIDDDLKILDEHISEDHLNIENSELIDVLTKCITEYEERYSNHIVKLEFFDFTCFILNFIADHEHLGITKNAIEIFVSYQSFDEMYSMFLYSIFDETLQEYIIKYSLLRKLNTYQSKSGYLQVLADSVLGEKSYLP